MTCEHEDELTAYLDGEVAPSRAQRLEGHLQGCPGCAATLALLRRSAEALARLPAPAPSPALRSAVLSRIAAEPAPAERGVRGWLLWRSPWSVAPLAVGAAAVLVLFSWRALDGGRGPEGLAEPGRLELAANLEILEDLEVIGLETPEDLEVVARLDELEAMP